MGTYAYKTNGAEKGLLHTYTDALNRVSTYSDYKRGLAQTLIRPDNKTLKRVVDDNGRITKVTDAKNQCTRYSYNNMGRLTLIDPCDATWSNTDITYGEADGSEHSHYIYAGMFTQTITQGNHQSIHYLDSLLRPVFTQEWDKSDAATKRFTRYEHDYANRVTFTSKPFSGATTASGTVISYDALNRITQVNDNTLSGTVNYYYENGNQIRVNDNRGNNTTTSYLAFGLPEYEQPLSISSPENVTTTFTYNPWGNVTAITQSGKNAANQPVSLTEHRAYNGQQQLCKVKRTDVGQTVYHHNTAGQLLWLAEGTGGGTATDCVSNASAADKVVHTYDLLDNVKTITYPGTGGFTRTFSYDNNNNVTRIVSGGVTQDYSWNSLNLLTAENLQLDGKTLSLGYGYTALGHISTVTYPDGDVVGFAPNALGQPVQAVRSRAGQSAYTYASGASYYPSGSIDTFTYGNGLTHKTTLNSAQLPAQVKDSRSGLTALDYAYQYDGNLNVTRLTDNVNGSYNLTSLTYDGLDRLTGTTGGSGIGSSSIAYDGLGNITSYQSKGRNLTYTYNYSQNRLTGVSDSIGTKDYAFFSYDDRGNITNTSFNGLTFNRANQVTAATTTTGSSNSYLYDGHNRRVKKTSSKGIEYSFYGQNGTLLYRENQADGGGINYIYLGNKLIAKDGFIPENSGKQHYRPYGDSIEGAADDVGYTGHKFDTDLGLSYMQARYYDPVIGRFYSNGPVDSVSHLSNEEEIKGFNRYSYAVNNPYKYTDPDGAAVCGGACIAGIGYGLYRGYKAYKKYKKIKDARSKAAKAYGANIQTQISKQFANLNYLDAGHKGTKNHKIPGGVVGAILYEAEFGSFSQNLEGKDIWHGDKGKNILKILNSLAKKVNAKGSPLSSKQKKKLMKQIDQLRIPLREALDKYKRSRRPGSWIREKREKDKD